MLILCQASCNLPWFRLGSKLVPHGSTQAKVLILWQASCNLPQFRLGYWLVPHGSTQKMPKTKDKYHLSLSESDRLMLLLVICPACAWLKRAKEEEKLVILDWEAMQLTDYMLPKANFNQLT